MADNPQSWIRFGGGINERDDFNISIEECIDGENFDLNFDKRAFTPRLPFDLKGTAPNAGTIYSIMQHIARNDSQTQLVVSDNILYNWNGTATFTTVVSVTASRLRHTPWLLDDLIITTDLDLNNVVGKWDGSAYSTLTHSISGVTDLYAKYGIQHQGRLWLANVQADADATEHMILASEFEALNFDNSVTPDSTVLTFSSPFYLLSPDLKPINGMASFFGTLVVSTVDGKLFQITGNDATDYAIREWYPGSSATGEENLINIGNDVQYVKEGNVVESLQSTNAFGDIASDDLSRWINTSMEAGNFSSSIMVYDQQEQRVYIFYALRDDATIGKVLVFDKTVWNRAINDPSTNDVISPWSKWSTNMDNRLVTKAATYARIPSTTKRTVYWGDASGNIYDVKGTGSGDGGATEIATWRRSRFITEIGGNQDIPNGRAEYRRKQAASVELTFSWADSRHEETVILPLKARDQVGAASYWGGFSYWGGTYYWGGGSLPAGDLQVSRVGFSAPGRSDSGAFIRFRCSSLDSWELSRIGL